MRYSCAGGVQRQVERARVHVHNDIRTELIVSLARKVGKRMYAYVSAVCMMDVTRTISPVSHLLSVCPSSGLDM